MIVELICPSCPETFETDRLLLEHRKLVHRYVDYRTPALKKSMPLRAEPGGVLACPNCGGMQFKVQRKLSTKLAFGVGSLLGQARWVRCVTCGERYRRS